MHRRVVPVLFILLMFVATASAETYKVISAEELKKMQDEKKQMVLVDARTPEEYREGHLPQAMNIPPEKFKDIARLLPKDKKALIVFYCRGTG
jgi:phage shock protein E